MKFNLFRFSLLFSVVFLLSSCLDDKVTIVPTDPSFTSLTFGKNDSIPKISTAVFRLEYDAAVGDSVIVNSDSLPYKTRIDSVFPTFVFKSSLAQYIIKDKDTIQLKGKDTIDFSGQVKVKNIAANGKAIREYVVKVNVHKVDPQLYVWAKINDEIESYNATHQKAIALGDSIYYYLNTGSDAYAYKTADGQSWEKLQLTGFPISTALNDMQLFNGKLYLTQDGNKIYSSSNCRDWTVKTIENYTFKSLLYVLDNMLWAVVQSNLDGSIRFANLANGDEWIIRGEIPAGFPVRDFMSLVFSNRNNKAKALVIGGYSADNQLSKHRWSTEDGIYWVDFRPDVKPENTTLDALANGGSLFSYDDKLFVVGSIIGQQKTLFKTSIDEGYSWQTPDTLSNRLPATYTPRSYQSVVVLKPKAYNKADDPTVIKGSNRIFIVGGKTERGTISEVWTGKLNRKSFLLQ